MRAGSRIPQGYGLVGTEKPVGWDQRRFAAPVHHEFSTFPDGGPALEASWPRPPLNEPIALCIPNHFLTFLPRLGMLFRRCGPSVSYTAHGRS